MQNKSSRTKLKITKKITIVARQMRRGDRPPHSMDVCIWKIWRDKEFLSLSGGKMEWESPPNILVTRNPNWS
jgi:hypothetical protein